jgi:hypothetical protein
MVTCTSSISSITAILGANGHGRQSRDQARDHEIGELGVIALQRKQGARHACIKKENSRRRGSRLFFK